MQVDVIIPYRNAEKWIKRCITSVRDNKGPFRVWVVNDNSTDKGERVAKAAAAGDDRFVFLKNEREPGVSGARNTGLDYVEGEWVTFLDADDEFVGNVFDLFKTLMVSEINQADHVRYYSMTGRTLNLYPNSAGVYGLDNLPLSWWGVWNKLYAADIVCDIRFDESLQYGEDEVFNLECLKKSDRIVCNSVVTVRHYVENKNSLSRSRTAEDLIKHIKALEDQMLTAEDFRIRELAFQRVKTYLNTEWYREAIVKE